MRKLDQPATLAFQSPGPSLCKVEWKNDSLPPRGSGSVDEGKNSDDWLRPNWATRALQFKNETFKHDMI